MLFRHCVRTILLFATILILRTESNAQSIPYAGPTDEAGDPTALRIGYLTGNRVMIRFSNKVSLGGWPNNVSLWPNDATGLNIFDSFNLIVGNMVFIRKCDTCAVDSIPVTDEGEIQSLSSAGQLDTLWYDESSSLQGGFMNLDPTGTIEWGFQPIFSYFNPLAETPAMSNHPETWPTAGWPSTGTELKWQGVWDGRFGKGVQYADLEAYWAANDAQDQYYLQATSRVKFYPRPSVKIGDINPNNVSVQKGDPWGGLGLRAEIRSFQWNNLLARDADFFEYNVSNISDYDLTRAVFGFYLDAANGNKSPTSASEDQIGFFDKYNSFVYTWSKTQTGFGGLRPCVSGWAFLESPGVPTDGIDNDQDGMINERRDNPAEGPWSGYTGPIYESWTPSAAYLQAHYGVPPVAPGGVRAAFAASRDTVKFLTAKHLKSLNQVTAVMQGLWWPGDEDGDWRDGNDANHNGVYDVGEDPGDDLGIDGVGPGDLAYTGPDADGSECNHRPDYVVGQGCEPNFDATDISEGDMLGLTSFVMFPHPQGNSPQLKFQKACYDTIAAQRLLPFFGVPSNLYAAFGSGTFRFPQGRTERLSMANVNTYDDLTGLNDSIDNHPALSLYQKLLIVKAIYENDYRFAQPPLMPTLTATAGDGVVNLSWDDVSDKNTKEPLLFNVNDFEGYKLYKATDKHFQDAEKLFDAYGNPAGKKPIFQCDLVDSISGFYDYTAVNGLMYNMGSNTGLKHSFVDHDVQNGRTYYYALVAYDYGIRGVGTNGVNLPPSENNIVIDLDQNENIISVGKNVQVVTPHQQAAGYVPPNITIIDSANIQADGTFQPSIFNLDRVKAGHLYNVKFDTVTVGYFRAPSFRSKRDRFFSTIGYSVSDVSSNNTILYKETQGSHNDANWETGTVATSSGSVSYLRPNSLNGITSNVSDGVQLLMKPRFTIPVLDTVLTGWQTGNAQIEVKSNSTCSQFFPYDYRIIIDTVQVYRTKTTNKTILSIGDYNNVTASHVLLNQTFKFHVINRLFPDTAGYNGYEELDMVVDDVNNDGVYEPSIDYALVGYPVKFGANQLFTGTIFAIRFPTDTINTLRQNDVYRVRYTSALKDSIMYRMNASGIAGSAKVKEDMKQIKVVPNPYIVTNTMEPYISNTGFNQQRRLLFTHIPAQSTIKIFTSSGVFIRQLDVNNQLDDGTAHWDMLTKEGLEIAAGIYVFQVKSKITGEEKVGKFAVIK